MVKKVLGQNLLSRYIIYENITLATEKLTNCVSDGNLKKHIKNIKNTQMHRNVAEEDSHALTREDATTKPEAEISKEKSKMKVSKKKMYLSA